MKVGDLVRYSDDAPATFHEFFRGLKQHDLGLIIAEAENKSTVKVKWVKHEQEFWMGKSRLEVVNEPQETKSN
jgi:hypothetical protein